MLGIVRFFFLKTKWFSWAHESKVLFSEKQAKYKKSMPVYIKRVY